MKKILLLSGCLFVAGLVNAQKHDHASHTGKSQPAAEKAVVNDQKSEILTVDKSEHNFGKIPQGKPVTTEFVITNSGTTSFKLDNVQAACGCTTPVWDKGHIIEPGTSTTITVGYNAAAAGPFTKPVTITYNGNQTKQLFIKGEVWSTPAESAPAQKKSNDL